MIQQMVFNISDPDETAAAGALAVHWYQAVGITIVGVSVSPHEDDAGATIDINDDASAVISAVDASDKDVPGTWLTPDTGGTQTPVSIAGGSEVTIDVNSAAAANRFDVVIFYRPGVTTA